LSEKLIVEKIVKGEFTWRSLPPAAMISVPTSMMYKTGSWRISKPVIDRDKCTKCLLCWVFCPDMSIKRLPDNSVEVDYEYCKGCGICAEECPVKAITIVEE